MAVDAEFVAMKAFQSEKRERSGLTVQVAFSDTPTDIKVLSRALITLPDLRHLFNSEIAYLQNKQNGIIIWPAKWISECEGPPTSYIAMRLEVPLTSHDALMVDEYRGDTKVVIMNVPERVSAKGLKVWFQAGMDDEFPELVETKALVGTLTTKLGKVNNQILLLPNLASETAQSAGEELEARRRRAQALAQLKEEIETQLTDVKARLRELSTTAEESQGYYKLVLSYVKAPWGYAMWEVNFNDDPKCHELALAASRKADWGSYYLMLNEGTDELSAGRLSSIEAKDGQELIPMGGVIVERRKHGQGLYRFLDERGFYSGGWRHGFPHGLGTTVNAQGKLQGQMVDGRHSGPTTAIYARGDAFRGTWNASGSRPSPSLIDGFEYLDGRAVGQGRLDFVDGSSYEGEFDRGVPCGLGKYSDVSGQTAEGAFDAWGMLHGDGAKTTDDVANIGIWRQGNQVRQGSEIDIKLGTYTGDFQHSLKHGLGRMDLPDGAGQYLGEYSYGLQGGRGTLDASRAAGRNAGKVAPSAAAESDLRDTNFATKPHIAIPEYMEYRCEGRWRAGKARAGCVFTIAEGRQNPLTFMLQPTVDYANRHLPVLDAMRARTVDVLAERHMKLRAAARSIREQRAKREEYNLKRFEYWSRVGQERMAFVVQKNRADRAYLKDVAASIVARKERRDRTAQGLDDLDAATAAVEALAPHPKT